ncbi:unnamed protein product [Microthlaspi erraticum]|uniref:TIR domain-containing protein n=1 Tax=Microthlaspi erraticum TaxID=1685480 RepID=A0A6D2KDF4_9BRAS|nr:unnamed protein product [Microthlaspi erraticum]
MATLSSPIHQDQVFINFRGKDIRHGFASHLVDALKRHNIKVFIDTDEQKGRDLKHLFKRIKESSVALVILSTGYAESKWCLDELKVIMEQEEKREMTVIPIFYKVRTGDVKKQKGVFGNRFRRRSEKSSHEEMEKWQVALKAVSNKFGFTLDNNRPFREICSRLLFPFRSQSLSGSFSKWFVGFSSRRKSPSSV